MVRAVVFAALALCPAMASAADGGAWSVPALKGGDGPIVVPPKTPYVDPALRPAAEPMAILSGGAAVDMGAISRIGAKWGRVTSTLRSVAHNRAVGGVPNSLHLSGRAIDIARRAGVSHGQIAAALRAAGYSLIESLDEGDHSHFAFGGPGEVRRPPAPLYAKPAFQMVTADSPSRWKAVTAGHGGGN